MKHIKWHELLKSRLEYAQNLKFNKKISNKYLMVMTSINIRRFYRKIMGEKNKTRLESDNIIPYLILHQNV